MAELRIFFDQLGWDRRPYGRIAGQRCMLAMSDGNLKAPWYETPIDSFQIVVPMQDLDLDAARKFVEPRLLALTEDGCVMVRYEPMTGSECSIGMAFAPGVKEMGFGSVESAKDGTVGGTVAELVEHVIGMVVALDVMVN